MKLLTDWAAKLELFLNNPCGIQINRKMSPSSDSHKTTGELSLEGKGLRMVSFVVVPITATTPALLGAWIQERDLLTPLLLGENSHESLMHRSKDLLKFLSRHSLLEDSFIHKLFTPETEELLMELVPVVSFSCLQSMIWYISQLTRSAVTIRLCQLLASIVSRCRKILMWLSQGSFLNEQYDGDAENNGEKLVFDIHGQCLDLLWGFAEEGSGVDHNVSILCMEKVQDAIDRGFSATEAKESVRRTIREEADIDNVSGDNICWDNHWHRCFPTVLRAFQALMEQHDLILSLEVIRAFILSFLDDRVCLDISHITVGGDLKLPPYRPAIVRFLEARFGILKLITSVIQGLKEKFDKQATALYRNISGEILPRIPHGAVPPDVQTRMGELRVNNALHSYYFIMSKAVSFVCFFQRTSFSTFLSCEEGISTHLLLDFEAIAAVWDSLFLRAITVQVCCRLLVDSSQFYHFSSIIIHGAR